MSFRMSFSCAVLFFVLFVVIFCAIYAAYFQSSWRVTVVMWCDVMCGNSVSYAPSFVCQMCEMNALLKFFCVCDMKWMQCRGCNPTVSLRSMKANAPFGFFPDTKRDYLLERDPVNDHGRRMSAVIYLTCQFLSSTHILALHFVMLWGRKGTLKSVCKDRGCCVWGQWTLKGGTAVDGERARFDSIEITVRRFLSPTVVS